MLKIITILALALIMQACAGTLEEKGEVEIPDDNGNALFLIHYACGLSKEDGKINAVLDSPARTYTIIGFNDAGEANGEWKVACPATRAGESASCKVIYAKVRTPEAGSLGCARITDYSLAE